MRRSIFALLTAAAVLAIALPMAQPSSDVSAAVPQGDQGLNGGWAVDDSGNVAFFHSVTSSLPYMNQAGAGWVRVVFRLGGCYSSWTGVGCNGRTALQQYDQVVNSIHAQNLHVLAILTAESWPGSQTDWTANNAEWTSGGNGDNTYTRAFGQAAAVLAQHFAGQVNDWEIWNEPNAWTNTDGQGHFWGSSYLYPSNYAWLLERSYQSIKTAEPSSHVMFGGLFAHESFSAQVALSSVVNGRAERVVKRGDMPNARRPAPTARTASVHLTSTCQSNEPAGADSGASYLCATYSVGLGYAGWTPGAYPFDDVGQHLYLALGTAVSGNTISSYLQDLRQAYLLYEGQSTLKRTQVTEVGWPTDQVTPAVQASNLQTAFTTLRNTPFVGRSYWFATQDAPEAGLYYGIVDTNGAAKPAFGSFQSYATYTTPPASPPTPTPTPVPVQPPVGNTPVQPLVQPSRVADTRSGAPIFGGTSRCFTVAGQGGVPPDAAGVVLNVTAVGYGASGWLTVYPAGQALPPTSTLNFDQSDYAIANSTLVGLGGGQVCVQVGTVSGFSGSAHVILDATGYLTSGGLSAVPMLVAPQRLADTRTSGGPLSNGATRCFTVAAVGAIPASASGVLLNVTAVGSGTDGWLTVYPAGQPIPSSSTVNFTASEYAIANSALVRVHSDQACVTMGTVNGLPGSEDVILDATGYLTDNAGSTMTMLTAPQRLVDTRTYGGPIATGSARCFPVVGQFGVPANAVGAMVNVTAVGVGADGWLTLYGSGGAVPSTSTLNYDTAKYAIANNAIARLGADGQLCVAVGTMNGAPGNAQVIVDIAGYLTP